MKCGDEPHANSQRRVSGSRRSVALGVIVETIAMRCPGKGSGGVGTIITVGARVEFACLSWRRPALGAPEPTGRQRRRLSNAYDQEVLQASAATDTGVLPGGPMEYVQQWHPSGWAVNSEQPRPGSVDAGFGAIVHSSGRHFRSRHTVARLGKRAQDPSFEPVQRAAGRDEFLVGGGE
jgi:hypothetical protein